MKDYFLPPVFFNQIKEFAERENFPEALRIVSKNTNGNISLDDWETEILLNIAKLWRLQAALRYPFWDSDHPNYNPEHEESFFDAQDETWGKIAMTFPVTKDHRDL